MPLNRMWMRHEALGVGEPTCVQAVVFLQERSVGKVVGGIALLELQSWESFASKLMEDCFECLGCQHQIMRPGNSSPMYKDEGGR